jgi:hypothetical protein
MDVHVDFTVTQGLRRRGVTVLTAQEVGSDQLPDADLLDHATGLGHVLVTQDQDFLVEVARRQASGIPFAGVVFVHSWITISQYISDLELLATLYDPIDMLNRLEYLPL